VTSSTVGQLAERLGVALSGRYAIERELGRGGMAVVYLAEDLKHRRQVALKVLRPDLAAVCCEPDRFLREIEIAARLSHPHILPLFDSGQGDGLLYYVMPFVAGESLRDRLRRETQLPLDEALRITGEVADALAFAHAQGVVHRDIKPENILFQAGHAVVSDFGIARAVTESGGDALTATGMAVGTPAYMSPEQAAGERDVDARSDIYALGCVLYEMLVGEPPFAGPTAQVVMAKRFSDPVPSARRLRSGVSEAVDTAVRRALAQVPADRFATAAEFATALTAPAVAALAGEKSIVVLPFENLSPDADNTFFADGLTEELIADLSKVRALRVISRNSTLRYIGTDKSLPQIAAELKVRYVLEGSVRRAGNDLRITAELIDATTDSHLWAEKYSGTFDDVFDMQEKVSGAIVGALQVRLSPREQQRLKQRAIPDAEVYADWLRARQLVRGYRTVGLEEAIARLEAGLRRIGDNAAVMAGLAMVHCHAGIMRGNQEESFGRAVAWAERALVVDPAFAQAHVTLGIIEMLRGHPREALGHLKTAQESEPGDWDTHQWLSYLYAGVGRHAQALAHAQALKALDPGESLGDFWVAWIHLYDGRTQEGVAALEGVQFDWDNPHRRWIVAWVHAWQDHRWEALELLEPVEPLGTYDYMVQLCLLLRDALKGDRESFRRNLTSDLVNSVRADAWGACTLAECCCLIGDLESALHWLDRAASWGWFNYPLYARTDPFFEPLRADPRFQVFLERVKDQWEAFET
jgi:serine/threonine protein kinase/tetratricopeptide (TPR) repeat protein